MSKAKAKTLSLEDAAHLLGMKVREVVSVEAGPDGDVITTHDGVRTTVHADGSLTFETLKG